MIVCSAITANDIPNAIVMAKSVKDYLQDVKVIICLIEKNMNKAAEKCPYFDEVILAKDLSFQWPSFERIIFKYNPTEAVSAIKGQLLYDLYYMYSKEDYFLYLDAKMSIISPCTEMMNLFKYHSIQLVPTQLYPSPDIEREHELLNEGTFENGFIALKRSDNASKFIDWFAERLNNFYEDPFKGLELDKKFLNLAMGGFDVHIINHPGYNVSIQNFHERPLIMDSNGDIKVLGKPLRLFNYKGIGNWQIGKETYDFQITDPKWSYDYFNNGEKILRETKVKYRKNPNDYDSIADLFEENNQILLSIK